MKNRNIYLAGFVILFFSSGYMPMPWSQTSFIISLVLIIVVVCVEWYTMLKKEPEIMLKFKIEYNHDVRMLKHRKEFLYVIVLLAITYLMIKFGPPLNFPDSGFMDISLIWLVVIAINVSNIIYYNRFLNCYLTSDGIFDSRTNRPFDISKYEDFHYDKEHKSFIFSVKGVETLELVPKSSVVPHEGVLIDWLESQLAHREKRKDKRIKKID